jgi:hypothetical protein
MSMRRLLFVALAVVGVVVAAAAAVEPIRKAVLRTLLLTTADPATLGLVGTTSMEPLTISLHTKRPEQVKKGNNWYETGRTIDRKVIFTAPAAYYSVLDLKEGPAGPQRVGFSVWSKKFDPAQPDLFDAEAMRRKKDPSYESRSTKYHRREQEGEYELRFEVSNRAGLSAEERQRIQSGRSDGDRDRPCEIGFDAELQMRTIEAPPGFPLGERACVRKGGVNFVKLNEDGSIKFTALCTGRDRNCQVWGYFHDWPVLVWVRYSQRHDWNDAFDRVQKFLKQISVEQAGG